MARSRASPPTTTTSSARTRALLDVIVAEPKRHARMLNTLSLLEHMGSHKIMATQHSAAIDQPTLKHVAEEAHHAFFMKRQAEKTAERALEYVAADLLAPSSARMYFQRLEGATVRALGDEAQRARGLPLYVDDRRVPRVVVLRACTSRR